MQEPVKGTVTPLASLFPPEEVRKASKQVQDALAERQSELDRVQGFIADNNALVGLVQRLPDELHHDIMVPFGKAAFFPGRLIHTNEFLVLLGEGYYAERTSKQTVEILNRRGKTLESQADSLKAMMKDLKEEASFFDTTAAEAAEGLVEISEVEESSSQRVTETGLLKMDSPSFSGADNMKVVEDEEYARMMSRLDELEKEELAAASLDEHDEDELPEAEIVQSHGQHSSGHVLGSSEESQLRKPLQWSKDEFAGTEEFPSKNYFEEDFSDQLKSKMQLDSLKEQYIPKDDVSHHKSSVHMATKTSSTGKDNIETHATSNTETSVQASKPITDSLKAFTGSIVERTHNMELNPRNETASSSQSSSSQPTKPVSRFKMQRR